MAAFGTQLAAAVILFVFPALCVFRSPFVQLVLHYRIRDVAADIGVLSVADPSVLPATFEFPVPAKGECEHIDFLLICMLSGCAGAPVPAWQFCWCGAPLLCVFINCGAPPHLPQVR